MVSPQMLWRQRLCLPQEALGVSLTGTGAPLTGTQLPYMGYNRCKCVFHVGVHTR